jgi:molybdopterin-guanine dinucleotide biosynthesis protein A
MAQACQSRCETATVTFERETVGGVVLTGGSAVRLDGADKATLEVAGQTLLERALAALAGIPEVVVVGPEVPTSRPVTFRREDPPGGGPAAALLAGLAGFPRRPDVVVALAVDMPMVTGATVDRLLAALRRHPEAGTRDGAVLVDAEGRRQTLCAAYRPTALVAPDSAHGWSMRRLVAGLRLTEVPATGAECQDVDTWQDVVRVRAAASGEGAGETCT